eukprot:6923223-Pyramimonas_sp.AAC.1
MPSASCMRGWRCTAPAPAWQGASCRAARGSSPPPPAIASDDDIALDAPAGPLPLEDGPPEDVKSPEAPAL